MQLDEYGGEAVNPEYLSMYERMVGMHKTYDPDWLSTHRQLLLRYGRVSVCLWAMKVYVQM